MLLGFSVGKKPFEIVHHIPVPMSLRELCRRYSWGLVRSIFVAIASESLQAFAPKALCNFSRSVDV
jgi:hypothetical protein